METCKVFGIVLNDDGTPDHGATVSVTEQTLDHPKSIMPFSKTYADFQGNWELDLPRLSTYEFTIRRRCIFNQPIEIPFAAILDTQPLFYP